MNKIKDIIYDYNDIFVALLIIVLAGAMLLWRVNTIMEYPQYLAEKNGEVTTEQKENKDVDFSDIDLTPDPTVSSDYNVNPDEITTETTTTETTTSPAVTTPTTDNNSTKPTGDVKFEVPKGASASKIADLLRQAGLIDSQDDFLQMLADKKLDTKLKAGTFTIPADADLEKVVSILTK